VQALRNLISNAIKFSEAGMSVAIAVRARDGEVRFDVSDEGRGIPSDKLETIFDRFEQVDGSDSRQQGGTGLGLTICRAIVELHGGRIWAHSTPGAGATVSFTLPA
jgi:signal transduction histidine kinase